MSFIVDRIYTTVNNTIAVTPFHTGHIGLIPGSEVYALARGSGPSSSGCEICVTPYPQRLETLFRLRCILREQSGVVHRLLRAIAAMGINIVALESATVESRRGHGVSLLLDWSTAASCSTRRAVPVNVAALFFPELSRMIPPNDLRYVILLRQVLGQCADVLDWTDASITGVSYPRIHMHDFEEDRRGRAVAPLPVKGPMLPGQLSTTGVRLDLPESVAAAARLATQRDEIQADGSPDLLHYTLLSEMDSKTLRIYVPDKGRERRMVYLGFAHKDKPGALFAISKLIADAQLSIFTGLVRSQTGGRNIFEGIIERPHADFPREMKRDPKVFVDECLSRAIDNNKEMLRYFAVTLQSPLYPKNREQAPIPLYDRQVPVKDLGHLVTAEEAESDIVRMKAAVLADEELRPRRWLTELLFAEEWGPNGIPPVFISYPRSAKAQAKIVRDAVRDVVKPTEFENLGDRGITRSSIEVIRKAHYFIGIWHGEDGAPKELSPWMHFEFGAAAMANKGVLILHHCDVADRLADRVARDDGRIVYSDLGHDKERVEDVVVQCRKWRAQHRTLTIDGR